MAPRRRLDAELVRRELVVSRSEAQALIGDHRVIVNGSIADKASRQGAPGDPIVIAGPPAPLRRTRRREARSRPRRVRPRCQGQACARCRRFDGRVHRLSAAARSRPRGGTRRRPRATARTSAGRPEGHESGTVQHPPHDDGTDRRARRPDRRRPLVHLVESGHPHARRPVPTWEFPWCSSSNRSSKRATPR